MTTASIFSGILVSALVTFLLRLLPFFLFREKKSPPILTFLSESLPYAVMAMLVIYCLRSTAFTSLSGFLPQLIAGAAVVFTYLWKRSTLLSVFLGTVLYMFLIQSVF